MRRSSRVVFAMLIPLAAMLATRRLEAQAPDVPGAETVAPSSLTTGGGTPAAEVQAVRAELERLRDELAAIRRQYDDRLLVLEQRLTQLGGGPAVLAEMPQPAVSLAPVEPASQAVQAAPASSTQIFNPATSVIGNFLGAAGKNPGSEQPSLQMSEAEVSFQSVVDPYARADFFLAAGPDGLDIEEGFITFTALPADLLLKVGKIRAQFGKVNTLHTHAMPTADRPLVTQNLVGGEEGLSDSGVSLSRLIHNPFIYLEATGELYAGSSSVFSTSQRSRLNYVGHVRAYKDLTEDKNLDLGASVAFGPTEGLLPESLLGPDGVAPHLGKRLFGIDATFRYRPLRRAIYSRLNIRTEMIWSRQALSAETSTTAFGIYGLGEYQFARRWYAGVRFDRSGRAFDASLKDSGGSFFVTFWPTEFSQLRTQYRRTNYAEGLKANELLFQMNVAIGAHGAHAF